MQWAVMVKCLSVSAGTLSRRRIQFGILDYSEINEEELDWNVRDILRLTPFSAEKYVRGALRACGIYVQRWKIREALLRIDLVNRAIRRRCTIQRRLYNFKKPNPLWHIDSDHKLIHWGFVLHGCIDGYSRAIVYIKCFSNNRAGTILQCFMDGIQEFGIPLRVRGDRGAENVNVARFMIDQKELSRGSFMASLDEFISQVESPWSTYYGKHVLPGTLVLCVCSPQVDDIDIGNISLYGVDPHGPVTSIETEKNVSVPESAIQLTDNQADDIKRLVSDPW